MIIYRIDDLAERAAQRYTLLTESWSIGFNRLFDGNGQAELVSTSFELAQEFLGNEFERIGDAVAEIASEARTATLREIASTDSTDLPEAAQQHSEASASYIHNELVAQIQRDIATMRQRHMIISLEVDALMRLRGQSRAVALAEYITRNPVDIQFSFYDRRAFRWSSRKFIRGMWRQALLSVYNETVLFTLADHGISRAGVITEKSGEPVQISVIGLDSSTVLPSYMDARQDLFHPNSQNYMAMEVGNV